MSVTFTGLKIRRTRPAARPRVCILRQDDDYEDVRREAEALAGAGFEVDVMCMRGLGRPRREVVNGVTVISLPADRRRGRGKARYAFDYGRFFMLAAGTLTFRHLRRPYQVVQANSMPDFLVFAALVPKLLGSRVIAFMAEPTPELAETLFGAAWLSRFLVFVEQRALRFADHAITVTDQLKDLYVRRGAAPGRITVVLNGADPGTILPGESPAPATGKSGFIAVCHGTIEDRYGQDTIIEAARLLRDQIPDLRVVITGRGSLAAGITRAIADNGLHDVVRFEGWVSREFLAAILHSADVGIVAQKASPYSHLVHTNKMIDYWIFGLPVIASRLRAVSATYDDHVIEYFEPGNAAQLATAIRRLHDDPARRAELAENGKLALLKNGWATQRETYLGVFAAVLGHQSAAGCCDLSQALTRSP
ncbi:MAG: glycosyltransferase family 4 protein [Streptosporangiaceae bacterium]|nr:glycosyltransferase family 4 protein [Streptosporangiaceae bacterium]